MIDTYRVDGYCIYEPFRVSIDGVLVRDKKGNPKKFHTMLDALSWAQRHLQEREREREMEASNG